MKHSIIFSLFIFLVQSAIGQHMVVRHSKGKSHTYYYQTAFYDAISAAQSGDTLIVGGGQYNPPPTITVSRLTIIGAGYHPDSAKLTKPTSVTGNIHFARGDSSSIEGFRINGSIVCGGSDSVNYLRISRCYMDAGFEISYSATKQNKFITITESNLDWLECRGRVKHFRLSNSIIRNNISSVTETSLIDNNIFTFSNQYYAWALINNLHYSVFRNNIVNNASNPGSTVQTSTNNLFSNNLWAKDPGYNRAANDTSKEVIGFKMDTVWVNLAQPTNFDFANDYHLRSKILAKYKGTDGTQPGLYGGLNGPWKEGGVPRNPHIQAAAIEQETDANGKLKVNIRVQAQKR